MKVLTNKIIIETENIFDLRWQETAKFLKWQKIQPIVLFYLNDFIDGQNWLIFYIMDLDLRSSVAEMFTCVINKWHTNDKLRWITWGLDLKHHLLYLLL